MKQLAIFLIPTCLASGSFVVPAPEPEWRLDYSRTCTFPVEEGAGEPESCDQLYRLWGGFDDEGKEFSIYQYKWISKDGREVTYAPEIGGFGVGIFTIGKLSDNAHEGGASFDPAVSHAIHRGMTFIGVPNHNYVFSVQDVNN